MKKFHLGENGEPGICVAQPGNCRYGDDERHYPTPEDARIAYEVANMIDNFPTPMKMDSESRRILGLPETEVSKQPRDSEGRPISEDGKYVWDGHDWAPARVEHQTDTQFAVLRSTPEQIIAKVRESGRRSYENRTGLRTYAIGMRNERFHENSRMIHLVEAEAPWNEGQEAEFKKFIEEFGLEYEMKKSRVSIFKEIST